MLILGIIGIIAFFSLFEGHGSLIGSFYSFASVYAGWKSLNKLTSKFFLFLPIGGWVIYFFIKIIIAALIGWIALPYRLFIDIRTYKIATATQNQIQNFNY